MCWWQQQTARMSCMYALLAIFVVSAGILLLVVEKLKLCKAPCRAVISVHNSCRHLLCSSVGRKEKSSVPFFYLWKTLLVLLSYSSQLPIPLAPGTKKSLDTTAKPEHLNCLLSIGNTVFHASYQCLRLEQCCVLHIKDFQHDNRAFFFPSLQGSHELLALCFKNALWTRIWVWEDLLEKVDWK